MGMEKIQPQTDPFEKALLGSDEDASWKQKETLKDLAEVKVINIFPVKPDTEPVIPNTEPVIEKPKEKFEKTVEKLVEAVTYKGIFDKEKPIPQDLGASADSQIGRLNEELEYSKERLDRIIRDNGPKKGIEYYKKRIALYEQEIKKEEEAKNRYLEPSRKKSNQEENKKEDEIIDLTDIVEEKIATETETVKSSPEEKLLPEPEEKKEKLLPEPEKELTIAEKMEAAKKISEKIDKEREKTTKTIAEPYEKKWLDEKPEFPEWQNITREQVDALFGKSDENTEKKLEQKGNWVMEKARMAGEWYKKQPLKYKVLLSGALITTAGVSALIGGATMGAIAGAAFAGSIGQRTLGGLATFVSVEAWLKHSAEKGGKERTNAEATRHTVEAAILGMLVGSGYFAEGVKNISDATGLTDLITDAYHYWLPPEDVEKIIGSVKTAVSSAETAPVAPVETPTIKLNVSETFKTPPAETPHFDIDTTLKIAREASKEITERGLSADFSIELGKDGSPESLERVFHMMAVNHMDMKDVAIFTEAEGAKSLNIAANLVKLAEGHNLADVDNIKGISAENFKNAASWDKVKNILQIKDHNAFNKIIGNLESRSNTLLESNVLKKGAVAYLNDIKPETWEKIIHADGLDKIGNIETGITGHDNILAGQIKDFNTSEIIKEAESTSREAVIERMENIRKELGLKNAEAPTGKNYEVNFPKNPEIATLADDVLKKDINELFGSKGFFGFGAKNGLDSPEWLSSKNIPALKTEGKIREYINNLINQTKTTPKDGETAWNFIKRAVTEHLEKNNKSLGSSIKNLHNAIKSSPMPTEIPKNNETIWFTSSINK